MLKDKSGYLLFKRVFDILCSSVVLMLMSPLFGIVSLIMLFDSKGQIIFKQKRVGKDGKEFVFYKFRTMHDNADKEKSKFLHLNEVDGPVFKIHDDPRLTKFGRIIRKFNLDELPQLLNILKGEMSFVGPRPPTSDEVKKYKKWQMKRLSVIPGLTSPWFVNGQHKTHTFDEWVKSDIDYIKNRCIFLDLKIFFRSTLKIFGGLFKR